MSLSLLDFAVSNSAKKTEIQDEITKVWTQIAEYFKNYGDYLIFETLNEVHNGNWGSGASAAEQTILFDWNQAALTAIRATGGNNAKRYVAVPGLGATEPPIVVAAYNAGKLLPNDPGNGTNRLIVAVHYYDPAQYTVAGTTDQAFQLVHTWGTSAEKNELTHNFESLKSTFIDRGIAVYAGEWGAKTNIRATMSETIKNTHLEYIGLVAKAVRENGVLPIYWDDGGDFKMLERSNGKPKTGLWADVLATMKDAINNTEFIQHDWGFLGEPLYNMGDDDIEGEESQMVFDIKGSDFTAFKAASKIVLNFGSPIYGTLHIVWTLSDWSVWKQTEITEWDSGTMSTVLAATAGSSQLSNGNKTLTVDLSALEDYDILTSISAASGIKFIIAYYGDGKTRALDYQSSSLSN